MTSEKWKTFFNGLYEVSNLGNIRRAVDGVNTKAGRLKKPSVHSAGYLIVGLYEKGKRKNMFVHRAVAGAFIGPCPSGYEVNHKDGNKMNNHIENLEYTTPAENMKHASIHGLVATGIRNGAYTHPESRAIGQHHGSKTKPERLARGDNNGSRKHPERLQRGEDRKLSKLTEQDVRAIRQRKTSGETYEKLSTEYNVSIRNVYLIVKRKAWRHVE